jgi:hypothetical protein
VAAPPPSKERTGAAQATAVARSPTARVLDGATALRPRSRNPQAAALLRRLLAGHAAAARPPTAVATT